MSTPELALLERMLSGDRIALAKLMTRVENETGDLASVMARLYPRLGGADILGDLAVDQTVLLRQLARVGSEQRVEKLPSTYLAVEDAAISKLIHDTQNGLLNAGLRAELLARFTGRPLELPDWDPPGREVPQGERVAAAWERWRQVTVYFADLWRQAVP